ncbi:uncharacterized protein AMSG_02196 [Thecamonas trahens ATCC 50062]|uniref:EF-hand domain-containing protein n=1 Tax=Thecamonas trahens ATCC 50062 TaxID=461836 RepID=A0A0L0DVS8_THETB|nr:hypothetical protein AMSG_02196 [Thecamonas trahens ATCC 50062]KNC56181.1 hypothetical protein AMSG_02196 [Thecamonas trahens ATCC 50062]|eukprot:XP_013761217.1 hypothetical protein AMSG_02196 [Thecamonas trahens ATCC 50062]
MDASVAKANAAQLRRRRLLQLDTEIRNSLQRNHLSLLVARFQAADADKSNGLDIDEFVAAFTDVLDLFHRIDANLDGVISLAEFVEFSLYQTRGQMWNPSADNAEGKRSRASPRAEALSSLRAPQSSVVRGTVAHIAPTRRTVKRRVRRRKLSDEAERAIAATRASRAKRHRARKQKLLTTVSKVYAPGAVSSSGSGSDIDVVDAANKRIARLLFGRSALDPGSCSDSRSGSASAESYVYSYSYSSDDDGGGGGGGSDGGNEMRAGPPDPLDDDALVELFADLASVEFECTSKSAPGTTQRSTPHRAPIVAIEYLTDFNEVLTIGRDGIMVVWAYPDAGRSRRVSCVVRHKVGRIHWTPAMGSVNAGDELAKLARERARAVHGFDAHALSSKPRAQAWINDVVMMPDLGLMALASDDFRVYFYRIIGVHSVTDIVLAYKINIGGWRGGVDDPMSVMEHVPLALAYSRVDDDARVLLIADSGGWLSGYTFSRHEYKASTKGLAHVLNSHNIVAKRVSTTRTRVAMLPAYLKGHESACAGPMPFDNWVRKLAYFPELRVFAACYEVSHHALVVGTLETGERTALDEGPALRVWRCPPHGITTFAACSTIDAHYIATGGRGGMIRLWKPTVVADPYAVFDAHTAPIVSLQVADMPHRLFSAARNGHVKLWDIRARVCLFTVHDPLLAAPAPALSAMRYEPRRENLFLASALLTSWRNTTPRAAVSGAARARAAGIDPASRRKLPPPRIPPTHPDGTLAGVVYEPFFGRAVSVAASGLVSVWDLASGRLVSQFHVGAADHWAEPEPHISTVALAGRRLLTATRSGVVHVWNYVNGQWLKTLRKHDNVELTALVHMHIPQAVMAGSRRPSRRAGGSGIVADTASGASPDDKLYIVGTGWNRRIEVWKDAAISVCNLVWAEMPPSAGAASAEAKRKADQVAALEAFFVADRHIKLPAPPDTSRSRPSPRAGRLVTTSLGGQAVPPSDSHSDDVLALDVCLPNLIATGAYDGYIMVWHVHSHQLLARIRAPEHDAAAAAVENSPDPTAMCELMESMAQHALSFVRPPSKYSRVLAGAMLASGGADGVLRIWQFDASRRAEVVAAEPSPVPGQCIKTITRAGPSASLLLVGDTLGRVRVYGLRVRRAATGLLLHDSCQASTASIEDLVYVASEEHPTHTTAVLVGSSDGRVGVFQLRKAVFGPQRSKPSYVLERIGVFGQTTMWGCDNSAALTTASLFSSSTLQHHGRTLRYRDHAEMDVERLAKMPNVILRAQREYEASLRLAHGLDAEAPLPDHLLARGSVVARAYARREGDGKSALAMSALGAGVVAAAPDTNHLLAATHTSKWKRRKRGTAIAPEEQLFQLMPVDGDFDGSSSSSGESEAVAPDHGCRVAGHDGARGSGHSDENTLGFTWIEEGKSDKAIRAEKAAMYRVLDDAEIRSSTRVLKCTLKFGELPRASSSSNVDSPLFVETDARALSDPAAGDGGGAGGRGGD